MTGAGFTSPGAAVWSVGGRYEVGPCIGRGGMAEVYEGRDARLGRPVAVKILKAQFSGDEVFRRRLTSEARAAARLSHPNVATVYDVGDHEGLPYIVMELANGGTLAGRLQTSPIGQGEAVRLTVQVLAALDAAHRAGILHRDIKPANILLTEEGTVKVTDFGIAKALEPAPDELDLTVTSEVLGTPRYLAPERAAGEKASAASDIWAVGVVLYEAFTGRPPFHADTPLGLAVAAERGVIVPPETYHPDLPPALGAAVTRALAPRPLDRFASASEMAHALMPAAGDPASTLTMELPTASYPEFGRIAENPSRPHRRHLLVGAGLLLVFLLLTAAALFWPRGSHPNAAATPSPTATAPLPSEPPTTVAPAPTTSTPTTEAPTISTSTPSALGCSVLRTERQALQQRQVQIDKAEKSSAGRETANRTIDSELQAIEQAMHQMCD